MAGQIVMAGYVRLQMKPWIRRLITRMMVLIPALIAILYFGEQSTTNLLISSQVFLSLQLSFAMLSLLVLTSDTGHMGQLVNNIWMGWLGWISAFIIILANVALIVAVIH